MIKYEFPLNERIRRFLRFDELFNKTNNLMEEFDKNNEYFVFERLFELMQTASRSDLRIDLMQETVRQILKFKKKSKTKKNNELIDKLLLVKSDLEKAKINPSYHFGNDKFLQEIKSRNDSPFGITKVDFPELQYWIEHESNAFRKNYLYQKLLSFQPIENAIKTLTQILRASGESIALEAPLGVYQNKLDPTLRFDLITLTLKKHLKYIPIVSSNKYAFSVHFNHAVKNIKSDNNIQFKICFGVF